MKTVILHIEFDAIIESLEGLETDQILLIVENSIKQEYPQQIERINNLNSKEVITLFVDGGEQVKEMGTFSQVLDYFITSGIHRESHLVVIGGGATSDMAGFVAATLLRGIKWSVIPTTLLSMVDASIGGKVGLNSTQGKNLIGAFHQPEYVWIDHNFLNTLPEVEWQSGWGEIVKYSFLIPPSKINFHQLQDIKSKQLIASCVQYKGRIVSGDALEEGQRRVLNLGHTFGHAYEKLFSISHGVAVSYGIASIFILLEQKEMLQLWQDIYLGNRCAVAPLPWTRDQFDTEKVFATIQGDKKRVAGAAIKLVTLSSVGNPLVKEISLEWISKEMERVRDELEQLRR
ncbi:MAG: 3-dehydroquinate synthase [Bdellovibrionales bacterium]|jgi:3-dehydroquinate synthase|nr:3-dehydroquinate synthase [Bdellovibrionales bacterium]MBT3527443.1 3-dehydroquinate synthase [Bdellovibrionales bacterium]MBT7767815.1 3-dehydroquinate synthase [Bdellovibrionales bacterium]